MKNKLIIVAIIGVFMMVGISMPSRSSAQVDQSLLNTLQTQIQALLKQIQDLQKQLDLIRNGIGITPVQPTVTQPVFPTTPTSIMCPELPKIIKFGSTGNEVKNIQKFLAKDKQVYPEGLATGYFGPMTEKALERFQEKYNLGVTGEMDGSTKEVLEKVIGTTIGPIATGGDSGGGYNCIIPPTPDPRPNPVPPVEQGIRVISPTNGEQWEVGKTYKIAWQTLITTTAPGMNTVSIRLEPYFACVYSNPPCLIAAMVPYIITDKTENDGVYEWTIPSELAHNSLYEKARITVSLIGQESIYGKSGVFSIAPQISPPDPNWNKPPVISGVSGPSLLKIGETGNWAVQAYDPENGSLSYSVLWGDEVASVPSYYTLEPKTTAVQNTATFTHVYNQAGKYTPIFYVTDDRGQVAKTSMSVVVGSGTSTNSPPVINMNALPGQVSVGAPVSSLWTATDVDGDSFFWTIYWGDGDASTCPPGTVTASSYSGYQYPLMFGNCSSYSVSHTWMSAGTYTVIGTVYDGRGGTDTRKFQIRVSVLNITTSTASST